MDKQATLSQISNMARRNPVRRNLMLFIQMPLLATQKLIEFVWTVGSVVYIPLVFGSACYIAYTRETIVLGIISFFLSGFILGLLGEWTLNLLNLLAHAIHRVGLYTLPKDERAVVLAFLKEQQS